MFTENILCSAFTLKEAFIIHFSLTWLLRKIGCGVRASTSLLYKWLKFSLKYVWHGKRAFNQLIATLNCALSVHKYTLVFIITLFIPELSYFSWLSITKSEANISKLYWQILRMLLHLCWSYHKAVGMISSHCNINFVENISLIVNFI